MTDNASIPPLNTEANKTTWLKPSLYGGRFTRKQYVLSVLLASIILSMLNGILQGILVTPPTLADWMRDPSSIERFQQESMQVSLLVFIPATIFVYLPFGIKRAHDIGHKGTFLIISQLLGFVAYNLGIVLALLIFIPIIIYGFILLFKDSQEGTNEYGPSIKYPDNTERDTHTQEPAPPPDYFGSFCLLLSNNKKLVALFLLLIVLVVVGIIKSISHYRAKSELENQGILPADYAVALCDASEENNKQRVSLLITAGADVNKANDNDGMTPLHSAVENGCVEIVKLLIAADADVNKANDYDGMTPLHSAVENGCVEIVKLLIAADADVNKADKYGSTPLHSADWKRYKEIVELLKQAGAKK